MDFALNRKVFIFIGLVIISMIGFFAIKSMTDKLEVTKNISASLTSLTSVNDIINQIKNENEDENNQNKSSNNSSNSGSNSNNKPSLKEEIEKSKNRLSKQDFKKVKSEYEQITDHINKLEKYKANPYKFDNKGLLKNAPNDQIRQKIINGRIHHLESEIETFYNNIIKTLSKVQ